MTSCVFLVLFSSFNNSPETCWRSENQVLVGTFVQSRWGTSISVWGNITPLTSHIDSVFLAECEWNKSYSMSERIFGQSWFCKRHTEYDTEPYWFSISIYTSRDATVRFAYSNNVRVEIKQTLCKPKTLPVQELRQRPTEYCRWETKFFAWIVYAPTSSIRSA